MNNYAGCADVDAAIKKELVDAKIRTHHRPEILRKKGEMETVIFGSLYGWVFERAWIYWVCQGPGIPIEAAMALHKTHGSVVRVNGSCMCPSPYDEFQGLGCGVYHVDTAPGLKALADTIKCVVSEGEKLYAQLS